MLSRASRSTVRIAATCCRKSGALLYFSPIPLTGSAIDRTTTRDGGILRMCGGPDPKTSLASSGTTHRWIRRTFTKLRPWLRYSEATTALPHSAARGVGWYGTSAWIPRSEEHTSELQSLRHLVCRLLLEKKTD